MHSCILLMLGPLGQNFNSAVWPWNIAMMLFVVLAFSGCRELDLKMTLFKRKNLLSLMFFFVLGILPFLNCFGLWPSYFSHSLYSYQTEKAFVLLKRERLSSLPRVLQQKVTDSRGEKAALDVNTISYEMNNVPAFPSERVFRAVGRYYCLRYPAIVVGVLIGPQPDRFTGEVDYHEFSCETISDE